MAGGKKYSYIKKAFAKNGFYSFFLAIFSLLLLGAAMWMTLSEMGAGGMNTGAVGLFSMVMALMSLWFTRLSFSEVEKNYLFAKLGGLLAAVLILVWVCIIAAGFRA